AHLQVEAALLRLAMACRDAAALRSEDAALDLIERVARLAIVRRALRAGGGDVPADLLRLHPDVDGVTRAGCQLRGHAHGALEPVAAGPPRAQHAALLPDFHLRRRHRTRPDGDGPVVDLDGRLAIGARELADRAEPRVRREHGLR